MPMSYYICNTASIVHTFDFYIFSWMSFQCVSIHLYVLYIQQIYY